MGATVLSILVIGIVIYAVHSSPIVFHVNGSCCAIKRNDFLFSSAPQMISGVYSVTNFCGNPTAVAQGYCDAASGGGGWLVIQMAVFPLTEVGQNMKKDLAILMENFGTVSNQCIA